MKGHFNFLRGWRRQEILAPISSFCVRTQPISWNSSKLSSLSNQPFYFSVTFPYFSRKRHVVSLPFVICYQSALWNLSCLLFKSVFLASFLNIFHEVEGEALTSYHTSFNSPRISCFFVFMPVIRYLLSVWSTFYSLSSLFSFLLSSA